MFEYAGASGGFIDFLGYPFSRGRVFDVLEEDKNQYDKSVPIFGQLVLQCLSRVKYLKIVVDLMNAFCTPGRD